MSSDIYRVSCEAIPEEISGMGTTPPAVENANNHPVGINTQKSYPGAIQPLYLNNTSNTVPPSPTAAQVCSKK